MAGKGELAAKWSAAKDRAKANVGNDKEARKAFDKLIKAFSKNLGRELDKVDAAAEALDRDAFAAARDRAESIMAAYTRLIEAAATAPLDARKLQPLTFAIAPQKEGAIPDLIRDLAKGVAAAPRAAVIFEKHSPKISAEWLDEAASRRAKGFGSYDNLRSRLLMLGHFTKGRASFYPADLDKVEHALDAFEADWPQDVDEDSVKTWARLRALVKGQAGAVADYAKRQRAKVQGRIDAVEKEVKALGKEIRDFTKAQQVIHQRVIAIDADSRTVVDDWQKARLPDAKTAEADRGKAMLPGIEGLQAKLDKLRGALPVDDALTAEIDRQYGDTHGGPPDEIVKALAEAQKTLRGLKANQDGLDTLVRDALTRLERFR